MDQYDLDNRFAYHPPRDAGVAQLHERIRAAHRLLAEELNAMLPDCRETSLAFTNLEQSMMWANAAIARRVSAAP